MARRQAIIAKTVKKPRVSYSEGYLINRKYMGDEPEFLGAMTEGEYGLALNWYNTMCDTKDAREYIKDYLLANGRKEEAKKLNKVSDTWVPTTAAWICRMLSRGYLLPISSGSYLENRLKETFSKVSADEPKADIQKASIQDRIREKTHDIIGEVEEMLDSGEEFSLYDWLKAKAIPANYASFIANYYVSWLSELIEAYEGKDEQLKEAYKHMTKKQLGERIKFMNTLISDAEKYAGVTKKTRAPSKPRPVSKEKLLKKFKYQKEDNTYKIASINPEKIIGAQELWCFNTKNKVLTVFRALDRGGLQVKGTSIVSFDEATSLSKGAGRKPELVLEKIQKSGKIVLKKLMDELKTDKQLQERINENTVLIKVT